MLRIAWVNIEVRDVSGVAGWVGVSSNSVYTSYRCSSNTRTLLVIAESQRVLSSKYETQMAG
jgi:hypothetical protein